MEIRARYVQMGAFTLAVLAAGFAFVYWLNNVGSLRARTSFQVRFESPVSGLLAGSAVLFNGIRVGEVTALALNPEQPRQVLATIAVDRTTPVRADTVVDIDFQGLTGSPVIALTGGSGTKSIVSQPGAIPLLIAEPNAGQSMSRAARDVLRRLDTVLAENAQPLRNVLNNLDTFAGALSRNSDKVDGIVAGLERMTGGARARPAIYDLSAPRLPAGADKGPGLQIGIPDPTALSVLDSEKIQSTLPGGANSPLPDVQWSDVLPRLVQMKLVRALEDAKVFSGVNRPLEGLTFDFQLLVDIRRFQIAAPEAGVAEVELAGKVLDDKGRIIATQVFAGATRLDGEGAAAGIAALDRSFGKASADLMAWVVHTVGERPERVDRPKAPAAKKGRDG